MLQLRIVRFHTFGQHEKEYTYSSVTPVNYNGGLIYFQQTVKACGDCGLGLTCSIELVHILELQAVQGHGLVQDGEAAAFLQQLLQLLTRAWTRLNLVSATRPLGDTDT